jgi:Tol biopolymer transport system component
MRLGRHPQHGIGTALAALATLLILTGCSMTVTLVPVNATTQPSAPAGKKDAVARKPLYLPDNTIAAASAPEPTRVNVFGELTARSAAQSPAKLVIATPALRQFTFPPAGGYDGDVAASPDGRWIVFAGSRNGSRSHLFRLDLATGTPTALTQGPGDDAQPCVSPDGRQIAFCSNRSGQWHLYAMDASGGDVTQLTDGDANEMHPSFAPDGRRLVFCQLAGDQQAWQLCVLDLATNQAQAIGEGLFPAWSPRKDTDVIAFQKARSRGSRWFSLWTCQLTPDDAGQIRASEPTEIAASPNAALVTPAWRPDGSALAFSSIAVAQGGRGHQDIWTIDAAGQNKSRLTNDQNGMNLAPCWGVDNTVYFVSDRSGRESVWSLPAPSTTQRTRTASPDAASAATDPSEVKP